MLNKFYFFFLMVFMTLFSKQVLAVEEQNEFDKLINDAIEPVSNKALEIVFYSIDIYGESVPLILMWLVAASIFFSFYLKFVNVRLFKHAIDLLRGKHDKHAKGHGQINRLQALTTSLSGTVGLGNIAGVAVAISVGGPGAMVWMILMGFFGMSAKFAECTLGVKYRHETEDGKMSGGPMYYLKEGFEKLGWNHLGPVFGAFFAVCCIGGAFGGGNMFQSNQAFKMVLDATTVDGTSFLDGKGWLFGLAMAALVGSVIIGGIKSIANVASRIVPAMAILYLLAGSMIIAFNFEQIDDAFKAIFAGAFSTQGMAGGFLGAIIQGVRRAAFSNEAGIGSASIAHAAVKTDSHISQGVVAMLGPFIDTVVICTMTALVIVISGVYVEGNGMEGVELTSRAFASVFSWFPYVLTIAVVLFAFSTMIAWSYYGLKAFTYLFGENNTSEMIYKIMFCFFVVIGSAAELGNVINFTDAMIFAMAIPNIIGLYILAPELKRDLRSYLDEVAKIKG